MAERSAELRSILARTRSDATLFERALRGDPVAFSEIYRRYHPRVYAFCLSRLLDPALAEDAAQETFVRFLHADPGSVDNPRSWLFGVARNVSVDAIRQRSRVTASDVDDDSISETAADSGEELLRREKGRSIMLAMRRLRPRYRTALILRELHGMSSAEIAAALETTPGAVDTLVNRARDAFGRLFAEVCDLPEECRRVFPLIYKRLGTGLDDTESARLQAHLEGCERCRAEARRASSPGQLAGAVPFLLPLGGAKRGAIGRLLATLDPTLVTIPSAATPVMQHSAVKVAAVALAMTAVVAAPVTSGVISNQKQARHAEIVRSVGEPLSDTVEPPAPGARNQHDGAQSGKRGGSAVRAGAPVGLARTRSDAPRKRADAHAASGHARDGANGKSSTGHAASGGGNSSHASSGSSTGSGAGSGGHSSASKSRSGSGSSKPEHSSGSKGKSSSKRSSGGSSSGHSDNRD